jgi:hypothetical protein
MVFLVFGFFGFPLVGILACSTVNIDTAAVRSILSRPRKAIVAIMPQEEIHFGLYYYRCN